MVAVIGASTNHEHPHIGSTADRTMLRRYLFVLGTEANRIDDLIQEVFLLVLEKGAEQRDPKAFGTFLRGCAKNMRLRELRSSSARREVELADEVWHEATERSDVRVDALRRCTDELPPRGRKLLQATYTDGMGRAAAAELLGMRVDGVKTLLRRLRETLRQCVERRLKGDQ